VHHDRLKPHRGDEPKPTLTRPLSPITEDAWEEEDDIPSSQRHQETFARRGGR